MDFPSRMKASVQLPVVWGSWQGARGPFHSNRMLDLDERDQSRQLFGEDKLDDWVERENDDGPHYAP